jgi:vacuolar-type H+-ATPase subunit H
VEEAAETTEEAVSEATEEREEAVSEATEEREEAEAEAWAKAARIWRWDNQYRESGGRRRDESVRSASS